MSNFLKSEKVKQVTEHIEKGDSIRKTSRETGVAKDTVTAIQRVVVAEKIEVGEPIPFCKCGQPMGHKGWCSHRLAESPKRQQFLMKQWGKLTFDDIAKKQKELLKQKEIEIQDEIKRLMAEAIRIQWRLCGLDEYLTMANGANEETDKEMESLYKEQIVDEWNEEKSKQTKM